MEKNGQSWTLTTLKEYFEVLLREHDRRFEQRFQAQENALKTALAAKDNDASAGAAKIAIMVSILSGLLALAAIFLKK